MDTFLYNAKVIEEKKSNYSNKTMFRMKKSVHHFTLIYILNLYHCRKKESYHIVVVESITS